MVRAVLSALAIVVVAAAGVALYFSFWREDTISIRVQVPCTNPPHFAA